MRRPQTPPSRQGLRSPPARGAGRLGRRVLRPLRTSLGLCAVSRLCAAHRRFGEPFTSGWSVALRCVFLGGDDAADSRPVRPILPGSTCIARLTVSRIQTLPSNLGNVARWSGREWRRPCAGSDDVSLPGDVAMSDRCSRAGKADAVGARMSGAVLCRLNSRLPDGRCREETLG